MSLENPVKPVECRSRFTKKKEHRDETLRNTKLKRNRRIKKTQKTKRQLETDLMEKSRAHLHTRSIICIGFWSKWLARIGIVFFFCLNSFF